MFWLHEKSHARYLVCGCSVVSWRYHGGIAILPEFLHLRSDEVVEEESYSAKTGMTPEWRQPIFSLVYLVSLVDLVYLVCFAA